MRSVVCLIAVLAVAQARYGAAQEKDVSEPKFEVVSVKPNPAGNARIRLGPQGNRLRAENLSPRQLIGYAYEIPDYRISGTPAWAETERFDVMAVAPAGTTSAQYRVMTRPILAERFGLRAHTEKRNAPMSALTLNREGKLGPDLKPSTGDCKTDSSCGMRTGSEALVRRFFGRAVPLEQIIDGLSEMTNSAIVNRTGLSGTFDFRIEWTIDSALGQVPPDSPPVFATALREQFGIRLETTQVPVDFLVIDAISRPTTD
jgi:uncharacterized protein (TIGR03435 family)